MDEHEKHKDGTPPRGRMSGIPVWCRYDRAASPDDLRPHPKNPNTHPEKQVRALAKVIRGNGWRAPITVSRLSGYITRGHCRLLAARHIGATDVPVEYQDYASPAEELADLLADNIIPELAEIDKSSLKSALKDLDDIDADMKLTGLDDHEAVRLLSFDNAKPTLKEREFNLRTGILIAVGFMNIVVMPDDDEFEVLDRNFGKYGDIPDAVKKRILGAICSTMEEIESEAGEIIQDKAGDSKK